jgi:tRNA-dihydrouridine synthase
MVAASGGAIANGGSGSGVKAGGAAAAPGCGTACAPVPPPPLLPPRLGDVLSVAPMMEWTDRHFRFLARLLTRRTRLYTEMVVANTLLFSPHSAGFLRFSPEERPVACQVGGSDPAALAAAAVLVERAGYDEVNLNCGCPSPRVAGKGAFGASLMFSPELVRDCVAAMRTAVRIPVTVKCRLGADDLDSYEAFSHFVRTVAAGGCSHFIVHARKCLLKGLDPKGNRTVPPLRYTWVQRLALEEPALRVSINGGVLSLEHAEQLLRLRRGGGSGAPAEDGAGGGASSPYAVASAELGGAGRAAAGGECPDCSSGGDGAPDGEGGGEGGGGSGGGDDDARVAAGFAAPEEPPPLPHSQFLTDGSLSHGAASPGGYGGAASVLDSVMVGRAAYNRPWRLLSDADRRLFGEPNPGLSRREVVARYLDYAEALPGALPAGEARMSLYKPFELAKPLIGLFQGEYGGARFRKSLTQGLQDSKLPLREAVEMALQLLPDRVLDERAPE